MPEALRTLYATAHEVSPQWLIEAAARRQKWIDQSQSLNLYVPNDISPRSLSLIYHNAWLAGIKTTYYLRSRGATSSEKATVDRSELNAVAIGGEGGDLAAGAACALDAPSCEVCQ